jgi:sporulation protein YlmC with PRC-barrel domain
MRRVSRRNLLGLQVQTCDGEEIGRVVDTWPDDGGWEMLLVVVRLQRFGERRMLPVDAMVAWGGVLRVPYTRVQIEDAPEASIGVHRAEDPWLAIAYWRSEEPARAGIVTPRWRRSSGFFVMERPSPTTPSPTPTAS